ncbi:DivIVA domain-containing protein [Rhodococcus sp. NPDC058514]|uniref:DivIVA domain-containing protein n=1 Tax=unclassified Rhodococcus (in: high G+C Gram-positive bacteria) TaxID=192944 RepID=UPI00365B506C
MFTVLLYLLIMALVGGLLFLVASAVFGRGEEMAPLPPGTTATMLPASDVTGADVRALRFQQTVRGYKASEVDWALDRLGREIDSLRSELASLSKEPAAGPEK